MLAVYWVNMKHIYFFALCVTLLHLFADAMHRGEYRAVKDHPYIVQLHFEYDDGRVTFCGAAILSEYWVISAAHCVGHENVTKSQVRVGSSTTSARGTLIDMEKVYVHGDFYPDFAYDNDIALIKVKTPIQFNEHQQPIQISKEVPKIGDNVTLLGFGYHHYDVYGYSLRIAQVPVVEDKDCFESYEKKYTKNMICTSTKDVDLCFGDSGGPAVYNNKLIGVIDQGCEYTKPNILIKVANYYDWILQITGINYVQS